MIHFQCCGIILRVILVGMMVESYNTTTSAVPTKTSHDGKYNVVMQFMLNRIQPLQQKQQQEQTNRQLQEPQDRCDFLELAGEVLSDLAHGGEGGDNTNFDTFDDPIFDCECKETSDKAHELKCKLDGNFCCKEECYSVIREFDFSKDGDPTQERIILNYNGVFMDSTRQITIDFCDVDDNNDTTDVPCGCNARINNQICSSCLICMGEQQTSMTVDNDENDFFIVEDCSNIEGFEFINYTECPTRSEYENQDHENNFICKDAEFQKSGVKYNYSFNSLISCWGMYVSVMIALLLGLL